MVKILFGSVVLLLGMGLWYILGRDFYEIAPGHFVTVWKTLGGKCYIIPGKYPFPWRPDHGYIKTNNGTWASGVVLNSTTDTLFYAEQGTGFVINNASEGIYLTDWSKDKARLDSLYTENGIYKSGVHFLTFCIHDGYARGELGKSP